MIYSCSKNWSLTTNPNCNGSLTPVSDESDGRYVACSVPYTLYSSTNPYLVCSGSKQREKKLPSFTQDFYLFQSDNVELINGYAYLPDNDLTTVTVSDYLNSLVVPDPDTNGNGVPSMSHADYTSLISLALPVLVIAFSYRVLYRLIVNR